MSDLIDRYAATQTALKFIVEYLGGAFDEDLQKKLMERMNDIPSALPEPHWIPCGERLPDTNRDVLLQFNTNMGVGFWENGEWGVNTGDNIYSEIGEGEAKPIAWMKLPEPYGGEHDG